jgi:hypothetical protein
MADDNSANSTFSALAGAILDGLFERCPELATAAGDHRHDSRVTIGDASYYTELSQWAARKLGELAALDTARLSRQNQVDAQILRTRLEWLRFEINELREYQWNPIFSNPGQGIYDPSRGIDRLLTRDFAPLPERLTAVAGRLKAMPAALAAARRVLGAMPEIHIQQALNQFAGVAGLIEGEAARLADEAGAAGRDTAAAIPAALEAIAEHRRWLQQRLADGGQTGFHDGRLGADLFVEKLRLLHDTSLGTEEILVRAEKDLAQAVEEIADAAGRFIDSPATPRGEAVQRALDTLAADATDGTTILSFGQAAFDALCRFVTEQDLVTLYGDSVEVIEMPPMDRGGTIAYSDSPGPLESAALPSVVAVSPPPDGWPPERVRSFYQVHNRHVVHAILAHEGCPGHALQFQHMRRFAGSTPTRSVFWSLTNAEGWAVYAEELVTARGYPGAGSNAALQLVELKLRLRSIINAIIDIRLHSEGMTEADAMALMTGQGFQDDGEAELKWRRALWAPAGKLSTYYVGSAEVSGLAADLRTAHPTWSDRQVHDAILGHGCPPVRHLRTLLELTGRPT